MLTRGPPAGARRAFLSDGKQAGLVAADQYRRGYAHHQDQDRRQDAKARQGQDGKRKGGAQDNRTAYEPGHAPSTTRSAPIPAAGGPLVQVAEEGGDSLATADAHGDNAPLGLPALELVRQLDGQDGAG